jgi:hypothetical protein
MQRGIVIVITALMLVVVGQAWGDDRPTDTDLLAAYCVPIIRMDITVAACRADLPTKDPVAALCGKLQSDLDRVRSYLLARGYVTTENASMEWAILAALQRGKADYQACVDAVPNPQHDCMNACVPECLSTMTSEACAQRCLDRCPLSAVCKRVARCANLDSVLPF